MPLIPKVTYRPDIDGLRAVAVLAVVLFHAGFSFPGGYVGVDVFFVISGFLITTLIWQDLEQGCFTFANFWEKRARRIIPALVVVTTVTLVAGWFVLLPLDLQNLGRASATQALFAANIHYWQDAGYFANVADEKPLLHTWSLAVEEQFYLFAPFALWGLFQFTILGRRVAVVPVLTLLFALSFILSIYGMSRYPGATFYLLPTRAWELLLGSLIVFLPAQSIPLTRRSICEFLGILGLSLILVPAFFYNRTTLFPGLAALPPCLGTALLIVTNKSVPTMVSSLLSIRPMVFIGLISYSLYLWHWPFLAFSRYLAITPLSLGHRFILVGMGFLCAILSWKYIETPFRKRKLGGSRGNMFALAGAGLATVLSLGLLCVVTQGFPQRIPPQAQIFANAASDMGDPTLFDQHTLEDVQSGNLTSIGAIEPKLYPTILIWGDSHAMVAMPAFDALLKEKGLVGRAVTHSSTPPILDWFYPDASYGLGKNSVAYNNAVISYIQKQGITDVVLAACWGGYIKYDEVKNPDPFKPLSLVRTVQEIRNAGARPWLMLDVPQHSFNIPKALAISVIFRSSIASTCAKPMQWNELEAIDSHIIRKIKAAGGQILDPKPSFLNPTGLYYIVDQDGVALYRDGEHLTIEGAKRILLPFLRESFPIGNK